MKLQKAHLSVKYFNDKEKYFELTLNLDSTVYEGVYLFVACENQKDFSVSLQ